jgi:excisionase family DNA binding protein
MSAAVLTRDFLKMAVLTREECAARLGCSAALISKLIKQDRLTAIRPGPRCTLITVESVEAFEQARDAGR